MTNESTTPKSKKLRVQLELIFDAVETDEDFEISGATANIEGSPELTMIDGLEMIHDLLGAIAARALLSGDLYEHLADDDTEGVVTITIHEDCTSERTADTNQV